MAAATTECIYLAMQGTPTAKAFKYILGLKPGTPEGQQMPIANNQLFQNSGFLLTTLITRMLHSAEPVIDYLQFTETVTAEMGARQPLYSKHLEEYGAEEVAVILAGIDFFLSTATLPIHKVNQRIREIANENPKLDWRLPVLLHLWYLGKHRGTYSPNDGLEAVERAGVNGELRKDFDILSTSDLPLLKRLRYDPPVNKFLRFWLFLQCYAAFQKSEVLPSSWKAQIMKEMPLELANFPSMCLLSITIEITQNPGNVFSPALFQQLRQYPAIRQGVVDAVG